MARTRDEILSELEKAREHFEMQKAGYEFAKSNPNLDSAGRAFFKEVMDDAERQVRELEREFSMATG